MSRSLNVKVSTDLPPRFALRTSAATARATTATAAKFWLGTRFVHRECAPAHRMFVEHLDGVLCIRVGDHLNEGKATRLTGLAITHDLDALNRARRLKQRL